MPNWHHNPMKWKCLTNKGPPSPSDDPHQILAERCHTTSSNAMHHKCYQIQLLFLIHDFLSVMPKTPQMQLFTASNDHGGWTTFHGKCPMYDLDTLDLRSLQFMYECYGLFTTKANHFNLEKQKLRKMVTNPVALSVLLFVTIFHYSLENMSKFLWFYDASFVGEMEDSINTTDTPYKMHGDNW